MHAGPNAASASGVNPGGGGGGSGHPHTFQGGGWPVQIYPSRKNNL